MGDELRGLNFLVVDDETMLAELVARALTQHGAQVVKADNGTAAWQLCEQQWFDALITDLRMPGGDGLALLKKIQARKGAAPKIFICSGYDDLPDTERSGLKVDRVFEKPFRMRDLLLSIIERMGPSAR